MLDAPFPTEGAVKILVPCERTKWSSEQAAPIFEVPGVFYRKLIDILKTTLSSATAKTFHMTPFKQVLKGLAESSSSPVKLLHLVCISWWSRQMANSLQSYRWTVSRNNAVLTTLGHWSPSVSISSSITVSRQMKSLPGWKINLYTNRSPHMVSITIYLVACCVPTGIPEILSRIQISTHIIWCQGFCWYDTCSFCQRILESDIIILASDLPAFLYDQDYNENAIDNGLLRGPITIQVKYWQLGTWFTEIDKLDYCRFIVQFLHCHLQWHWRIVNNMQKVVCRMHSSMDSHEWHRTQLLMCVWW